MLERSCLIGSFTLSKVPISYIQCIIYCTQESENAGPQTQDGKIQDYSKPVRGHKFVYETVKVPRVSCGFLNRKK